MAVVMGETYPELFSAVGVHSGLSYKSASDVVSAFAAMRGDLQTPASSGSMRTIVFHGDADTTVVPLNAREIINGKRFSTVHTHQGVSTAGRNYAPGLRRSERHTCCGELAGSGRRPCLGRRQSAG